MHAVVVRVSIKDREAATQALKEDVVPAVSQAPGFVAGYWTRKEGSDQGLSMTVFESEDAANAAAERVRSMAPEDVTVDDVEVREVVASA
jgi:heme-degrading monooxygenase HmoA